MKKQGFILFLIIQAAIIPIAEGQRSTVAVMHISATVAPSSAVTIPSFFSFNMEEAVPANQQNGIDVGDLIVQQVDADIFVHVPETVSLSNGNGDKADFGLRAKKNREERSFTYSMELDKKDNRNNLRGAYSGNCKIRVEYN